MEAIEVAKAIEGKIELLESMRVQIRKRAEEKARAISEYDKALSISMIRLRENYPTTMVEKLAKGECSEKRYELELAGGLYKSLISNIDSVQSELNGLQSINRHLSEL